jgi:hypothetical protein
MGVDQPKVLLIYGGRLDDFSVERRMRFLTALHRDSGSLSARSRDANAVG